VASLCGSCAKWTFNDGSQAGWTSGEFVRTNPCYGSGLSVQSPGPTPPQLDGQALVMVYNGDSYSNVCYAGLGVSLCGGSGASLGGKTLHANVYWIPGNGSPSSTFPGTIYAYAETYGGGTDSSPAMTPSLGAYSWTPISATFANNGATDLWVGFLVSSGSDPWAGQELWFDNIYIQ